MAKEGKTSYNTHMNKKITIDIKHVAKLANIPVSDEQTKKLEKELEATLAHVERLNEIDTSSIEGTNEVTKAVNVMREDEILPSLSQEEALQNATQTYNGFFMVPVIIEEAVE